MITIEKKKNGRGAYQVTDHDGRVAVLRKEDWVETVKAVKRLDKMKTTPDTVKLHIGGYDTGSKR